MYPIECKKTLICLVLLVFTFAIPDDLQLTEGYYMSQNGMTHPLQIHKSLVKMKSKIALKNITYTKNNTSYTISNTTLELMYLDGKQKIKLIGQEKASISGGIIQFEYIFNYTKVNGSNITNGYALGNLIYDIGTVTSDSLNYTKQLQMNDYGYLVWTLPNTQPILPLTMKNDLKIKRMEPFNQIDLIALEDMLGRVDSGVSPSTMKTQLVQQFNTLIKVILIETLAQDQIFSHETNYTYQHSTKGELKMRIVHGLSGFNLTQELGFVVLYFTSINSQYYPNCNGLNVPFRHLSWQFYGGIQNIHLICLYQLVVEYMQNQTWLDTKLDTSWDSNAFQFYAGDLYDLINSLSLRVNARELVTGQCLAQKQNLKIKHQRQQLSNILSLFVSYKCKAKSRNKAQVDIDVLDFLAHVKFFIKLVPSQQQLGFIINDVQVIFMHFSPVGQFHVGDVDLATFKATQVMRTLIGSRVFGTGFPLLPMEHPSVQILGSPSECLDNCIGYFDKTVHGISHSLIDIE